MDGGSVMAFEEMEKEGKEKIVDAKILLAVLYKELNGGRSPSDDTMELIDKFIDQLVTGIMTVTSKAMLAGMMEAKKEQAINVSWPESTKWPENLTEFKDNTIGLFSSNGTLNIDLSIGNLFEFTLNENITKLTISNWGLDMERQVLTLILTQSGSYNIDWGDILWANGISPDIKNTSNSYVITIVSEDEGVTKYGQIASINPVQGSQEG